MTSSPLEAVPPGPAPSGPSGQHSFSLPGAAGGPLTSAAKGMFTSVSTFHMTRFSECGLEIRSGARDSWPCHRRHWGHHPGTGQAGRRADCGSIKTPARAFSSVVPRLSPHASAATAEVGSFPRSSPSHSQRRENNVERACKYGNGWWWDVMSVVECGICLSHAKPLLSPANATLMVYLWNSVTSPLSENGLFIMELDCL